VEHAHTYVRCGQCHRRWRSLCLVAAHQKRPRVWRAGAWQHSDASCQRASIERVRVAAGSGALATRTTVSVLRPAEPEPRESSDSEGDGRLGSDEDLGLDIEECLEDERAARQLHTDGQTLHVFRGGPAAQGPACLGDAVAPAEEAEVCARPKQTPRLSATEAGYVAYTAQFALTDKAADGRDRPGRTHGEPWACPVYMCISYMHAAALHIGHALVSSYVPNGHALFCEAAGPKCI
jgi:hypothetical protein